ncbi:MAG: hypothetical protein E4H00_05100, partial [Myxococcales bacterium]
MLAGALLGARRRRTARVLVVRECPAKAAVAVAAILLIGSPTRVSAYDAILGWEPVAGAAGYQIELRYDSSATSTSSDIGTPATASDGVVRAAIRSLPVGPTVHFTVAAYDAGGTLGTTSASLSIAYPAQATVSDSDGDGLTDAEEDVNLNGVRDPGETDSKNADTDGDGVSDRDEIMAGTDPLSAAPPPPPPSPSCASACGAGTVCDTDSGACVKDSRVWLVPASESSAVWRGAMTRDSAYAGGLDLDPNADALASQQVFAVSTRNAANGGSGDEVRYSITLPGAGDWYLWGRFYFPGEPGSNDANSLLVRVDAGTPRKLGNNKDFFQTWHWDGDGAVESGAVVPLSLGRLSGGTHELVVEKREVSPIPPRLDGLVLTRDSRWTPRDGAATSALGSRLSPGDPLSPAPPASTTTTTSTTTSTATTSSTTTSTTTSTST